MLNKEWLDIVYWGNDTDVEYIAIIDRKNNYNTCVGLIRQKDRDDYAIEQACRQYVKENGFKLEWLLSTNMIEEIVNTKSYVMPFTLECWCKEYKLKTLLSNDIEINIMTETNTISGFSLCDLEIDWEDDEEELKKEFDSVNKLIAWLYANDIEVVK